MEHARRYIVQRRICALRMPADRLQERGGRGAAACSDKSGVRVCVRAPKGTNQHIIIIVNFH